MLSQPLIFGATMLLANKNQMGCKYGNNYAVLSPYITPTYILIKRKKKVARLKIRIIKNANEMLPNIVSKRKKMRIIIIYHGGGDTSISGISGISLLYDYVHYHYREYSVLMFRFQPILEGWITTTPLVVS